MAAVLLGTLYPLFLDALDMGKISVGAPYFDSVFLPLMAPAIFLMAVGPVASWKRAALPYLWTRLRWALAVSLAAALVLPLVLGKWSLMIAFGLWLGLWVVAATIAQFAQRLGGAPQATLAARLAAQSLSWYGMTLAHLGIAVFIFGVTLVRGYETERDLRMAPGDKISLGGYEFAFRGTQEVPGPNYTAVRGEFEVRAAGSAGGLRGVHPGKRGYHPAGATPNPGGIHTRPTRPLYVSPPQPRGGGAPGARLYPKP